MKELNRWQCLWQDLVFWIAGLFTTKRKMATEALDKIQNGFGITSDGEYSAFTVAELGEMLMSSNIDIPEYMVGKQIY